MVPPPSSAALGGAAAVASAAAAAYGLLAAHFAVGLSVRKGRRGAKTLGGERDRANLSKRCRTSGG